jgi:hypothetical protein
VSAGLHAVYGTDCGHVIAVGPDRGAFAALLLALAQAGRMGFGLREACDADMTASGGCGQCALTPTVAPSTPAAAGLDAVMDAMARSMCAPLPGETAVA